MSYITAKMVVVFKYKYSVSLTQSYTETNTQVKARDSLVAQLVKNSPSMQETWVQSLGWGDSLEKGKATHSSIQIPWGRRVGHD